MDTFHDTLQKEIIFEFSLNVFTESAEFSGKIFMIKRIVPTLVKYHNIITARARHR